MAGHCNDYWLEWLLIGVDAKFWLANESIIQNYVNKKIYTKMPLVKKYARKWRY